MLTLFYVCFCINIVFSKSDEWNKTEWTVSELLSYASTLSGNKYTKYFTVLSPNGNTYYQMGTQSSSYLFLDPNMYISDYYNKITLNDLLNSIYQKYQIKTIFIVIKKIVPFFGKKVDINTFATKFSTDFHKDMTLSDYMTILFSIDDNIQTILTGYKVDKQFNSEILDSYLYDIKNEISKKKYQKAFIKLLQDIDTKKVVNYISNDEFSQSTISPNWMLDNRKHLSLFIIVVLPLIIIIALLVSASIQRRNLILRIHFLFIEIKRLGNKKEIFDDYCMYCLNKLSSSKKKKNIIDINEIYTPREDITDTPCNNEPIAKQYCCHQIHQKCLNKSHKCPICFAIINIRDGKKNIEREVCKVIVEIQRNLHPILLHGYYLAPYTLELKNNK